MSETDLLQVEQCDREAAARFYEQCGSDPLFVSLVSWGRRDTDLVQAFARHRLSARPVVSEREQIVAWLRGQIDEWATVGRCEGAAALEVATDAIERGDRLSSLQPVSDREELIERIATALCECSAQIHEDGLSVWHRYARAVVAVVFGDCADAHRR